MRFCDKLAKLRKSNNFSQEQLAEKLGVSRQAVSKWESGSTYPDMEKMIQMCEILNCTLEELLDDGIINTDHSSNHKNNLNSYFQDLLGFITKTYNMFCSMTFKQKLKCLAEIFIMILFVLILGGIIFSIFSSITYSLLQHVPYSLSNIMHSIFHSISLIILLVLGAIIVIHLFKLRYLDYYVTIEDKNVHKKIIEKEVDTNYRETDRREKVIIRDPKHSSVGFLSLFAKVIIYSIKVFLVVIAIPMLLILLFLLSFMIIGICHIKYSILFLFISIGLLGGALLVGLTIYFIYNFLFNRRQPFRMIFIFLIISLVFMAIGIGLSVMETLDYEYTNLSDQSQLVSKTEYVDILDHTSIFIPNCNEEYVIDNSLTQAKIEISYPKILKYDITHVVYDDKDVYHIYFNQENILDTYHVLMNSLKKKKVVYYDNDTIKAKIYVSEENYQKITADQ